MYAFNFYYVRLKFDSTKSKYASISIETNSIICGNFTGSGM